MAISQWNSFNFFFKMNNFLWRTRIWPRHTFILKWTPENWYDEVSNLSRHKMACVYWIFTFFFSKCSIFGGESEFCQKKFWNWIGPPKNLMCMSDSYEWFLLENLLTFTRHKMACVWWIFPSFFFKVNYFWWGIQILSERSSKLKWTPEELNVHEWLISVIFS